jgi:predicted membrane protein
MNEFQDEQNRGLQKDDINREMRSKPRNHIWAGLFILGIGAVLLLRQSGVDFPFWFFTWPMILIAIGILGGIKHRFRPGGWLIVLAVGGIFLAEYIIPGISIQQIAWPLLIMAVGFWIIVRPRTHHRNFGKCTGRRRQQNDAMMDEDGVVTDSNDVIETTSVFGGVKKIVLSKNFKGGEIVNVMGGTELNLIQSDIKGRISIDTTNIFGGTKLIVPPTWDVQSDIVAIFGGVDDKRRIAAEPTDPTKIIHLSGVCLFGGIEIKSY